MVGFPDDRELRGMHDRREELDAQLRIVAAGRVRGFQPDPPPAEAGWCDQWESMAAKIEHYRLR